MALQKINWLQIDTENIPLDSSGSLTLINLGYTGSNQLEAVYARNLFISGQNINDIIEDNSGIFRQTGSFYATTNDLQVTGSVKILGDLSVEGTTTLMQNIDPNVESLIVSGAVTIVKNDLMSNIVSASLLIENLGALSDRAKNSVIDCGDSFF